MSLHVPPLYERVIAFTADGKPYGFVYRTVNLDGATLIPIGAVGTTQENIAAHQQLMDEQRYD